MAKLCLLCIINGKPKSYGHIGAKPISDEDFTKHLEMEHDTPVQRDGEGMEACLKRFKKQNPRAGTKDCRCSHCDPSILFNNLQML